jgi:uncharacterized protein DUF4288
MNWYITSLLFERSASTSLPPTERCHYLIQAENHEGAYDHSLILGSRCEKDGRRLLGIEELLLLHEEPADRNEIIWEESELPLPEIEGRIQKKEKMRAFHMPSKVGWYLADVILSEMHDEGKHGGRALVWKNSYLISAVDAEHAYGKAVQIGREQEDLPEGHLCGKDHAHWVFRGLADLIPLSELPAADGRLWCDDLNTPVDDLRAALPRKTQLGVFRWDAERVNRSY